MISLDNKAYFWKEFDENHNPINPKECQILFTSSDGGKIIYLMDMGLEFLYDEHKNEKIELIYGQVKNGEKFTLLNLSFEDISSETIFNGITLVELEYSVGSIFYGAWVKYEDFHLYDVQVRYSYLEAWLQQMKVLKPYYVDDKNIYQILIQKEHLKGSTKDYDVIFNIHNELSQSSHNGNRVIYNSKNFLAMAKKNPFRLDEVISLSLKIKSFFEILTFYSQRKIFIEELIAVRYKKIDGCTAIETASVLFQQKGYQKEEEISTIDFLFTYASIKDNFVRILNNWIQNHDKNSNEFGAFCNVVADRGTKLNIYSHLFQLISAMEGYHRKNSTTDEEEKKKNRVQIITLISQLEKCSERKLVAKKFKYDYEPNFRNRLNELIKLSDIKSIITLNSKLHRSIANLIYNTRNDIAHSNKSIIVDDKIGYSYEYLKLVALLIMIKDISLNKNHISKHVLDIYFKHLKDNLEKAFAPKEIV